MTESENDGAVMRDALEWAEIAGVHIIDPAGWRGSDGTADEQAIAEKPLEAAITREEFDRRAAASLVEPLVEEIKRTSRRMPIETRFNMWGVEFQKEPGGGMTMQLLPMTRPMPGMDAVPIGLAVRVPFGPDEWAAFKENVANDGVVTKPRVEVARVLPPDQKIVI